MHHVAEETRTKTKTNNRVFTSYRFLFVLAVTANEKNTVRIVWKKTQCF